MPPITTETKSKILSSLRLIAECAFFASLLGIAMDLVTAHVAVEYFTVHHPHVVDSESPLVMALVWGIGAAWWFGAIAGIFLSIQNWVKPQPAPISVIRKEMIWACFIIWLIFMAILASVYGLIDLLPIKERRPSFESDRRIMAVALTHMTEYVVGSVALVIVMIRLKGHKLTAASSSNQLQRNDVPDSQ